VNFKNATKWQAEGIFKNFFPHKSSTPPPSDDTTPSSVSTPTSPTSEQELGIPKRKTHLVPVLEEMELSELAKRFADAIPEDELSVAALQGYLLKNKTRPREAVDEVGAWVLQERETRAKLKKEKEEREAKEKKEIEEKAKKEKEELEAKEKAEKELKEKEEKAKEKVEKKDSKVKSRRKRVTPEVIPPPPPPTLQIDTSASSTTLVSGGQTDTSSVSTSSSESDSSNGGVEADTEDSMTSEEEVNVKRITVDQVAATPKEKWVAVVNKGSPESSTVPPSAF